MHPRPAVAAQEQKLDGPIRFGKHQKHRIFDTKNTEFSTPKTPNFRRLRSFQHSWVNGWVPPFTPPFLPLSLSLSLSLSPLPRYANRARNIKNKPIVNIAAGGGRAECAALRAQVRGGGARTPSLLVHPSPHSTAPQYTPQSDRKERPPELALLPKIASREVQEVIFA